MGLGIEDGSAYDREERGKLTFNVDWSTNVRECVFCSRQEQPEPLFETSHFYAMPDKFPLTPGHTLIITKDHLACYGAAEDELFTALESTVAEVEVFLRASYGQPVLLWENGVAGQSVFHAHLHLIPLHLDALPAAVLEHPDLAHLADWRALRERYTQHGSYRLLGLGESRFIAPGHSSVLRPLTHFLAEGCRLTYGPEGWVRTVPPEAVAEVGTRWRRRASGLPP